MCSEAEAAQGAAPRAEGLDVERLADAIEAEYDAHDSHKGRCPEHTGTCQWARPHHRDLARRLVARLSRPSDERVPESEEPR